MRGNFFKKITWKEIQAGDILKIAEDEFIPADLIILSLIISMILLESNPRCSGSTKRCVSSKDCRIFRLVSLIN